MLYIDYAVLKISFNSACETLNALIDKEMEAFAKTLPSAIRYDVPRVMHSTDTTSQLDDFILTEEALQQHIRTAKMIVYERAELLSLKEQELRNSTDLDDIIYTMRYIDGKTWQKIADELHYSDHAIYYHKRKIDAEMAKHKLL